MSNRKAKMPSYRYHKPSGQAVVTLDGRDRYLGRHGSPESFKLYAQLIDRWRVAKTAATPARSHSPSSFLTVGELMVDYFEHAHRYYVKDGRPTSEIDAIRQALKPLRHLHQDTLVSEFGPLALKEVRELMVNGWNYVDAYGRERRASHCRKTINANIHRIRQMFRWGVENEIVEASVYESLKSVSALRRGRTPARESRPVKPVAYKDIAKALRYMCPQVAAIVRIQLRTGARPGEICALRPRDIRKFKDGWAYVPGSHKTEHYGKSKVIPLGPRALRALKPWLDRDPNLYCFSPREAELARNLLRRNQRKSPMTPSQRRRQIRARQCQHVGDHYDVEDYRRAIGRACRKAGIEVWTPNRLRHTAATAIREAFGLEAATAVLGHSEVATTEIYAERNFRLARAVSLKMG